MAGNDQAKPARALTPKQEAFCIAVASGNGISDAYRSAYDHGGMKPASVNRMASELMTDLRITSRIAELKAPVIAAAQITLADHLKDLQELREEAKRAGQLSAAITAEVARGKASGLYVDRSEVTGKDGKPLLQAININLVKPDAT